MGQSTFRCSYFSVLVVIAVAVTGSVSPVHADEQPALAAIRTAISKSLPLLEKGAKGSMEARKQCFTCHNQGLPIMALTLARTRGFDIDDEHIQAQLEFTREFLARNQEDYKAGKGQGGQIDTAGFAMWMLENCGHKPDELTAAVSEYFLLFQKDRDYWRPQSRRPPTEQSYFTSTYVALRGLRTYGTPEQKDRIALRTEQVLKWMLETKPVDTEDHVFRLRGLHLAGAPAVAIQQAVEDLLKLQRDDGGWAQLADASSDVYATGTALAALHQSGSLATESAAYQKGLKYLLSTQCEDGSWHVVTRSKPIQVYYESGYPHEKDQFISIAAASWATVALTLSVSPE